MNHSSMIRGTNRSQICAGARLWTNTWNERAESHTWTDKNTQKYVKIPILSSFHASNPRVLNELKVLNERM